MRVDWGGQFWINVTAALVGAGINVVTTFIAAQVTGQDYTWRDATFAALSGGVNAVPGVGKLLSGLISGIYAGSMSYKNGTNVTGAILVGTVAGICTSASISNLATYVDSTIKITTTAVTDLVFGIGYNSMAAATYKAVTNNTKRTVAKPTIKTTAKNGSGKVGTGATFGVVLGPLSYLDTRTQLYFMLKGKQK